MCQYYAHAYTCKHLTYSFARYCPSAGLVQRPCAVRDVWHTIGMDAACDECFVWFPDQAVVPRPRRRLM